MENREQETFMTGEQLQAIQYDMGMSDRDLVWVLGLSGDNADRDLRKYKNGTKRIPGTFACAVHALRTGFRPPWAA